MQRSWPDKFRDAFRGLWLAVRQERSYTVHFAVAVAVIVAATAFRVSLVEWCLLILSIAGVLAAETFNTALERLAKEVDREENAGIAAALEMASAAVLLAALGAAAVGAVIFLYRLTLVLNRLG